MLVPHYRRKVPFKQMGWSLDQILWLIVELGMYEWAAKYIVQFFICVAYYDWGVKNGYCTISYKVEDKTQE